MIELFVIFLCLFINGILSCTEMAFITVPRSRLRELAHDGSSDARRLLALRDNPERTLSVIQVGITLVGAVAAAMGGVGAEQTLKPVLLDYFTMRENTAGFIAIIMAVVPLTAVNVVIGELVPKSLALRHPETIALYSARWLILFDRLLTPAVSSLEWATHAILKLFPRAKPPSTGTGGSTVELASLSHQARQYVVNLVDVEKKRIADIYVPWNEVIAARYDQSLIEIERLIVISGHTRIPIVLANGAVGLINTKEFMTLKATGRQDWNAIIRPMVAVSPQSKLLPALRAMQVKRSHLSLVAADTQRLGIVAMEDILEQIIGDILDEDDDGAILRILSRGGTIRGNTPLTHREQRPEARF